MYLQACRKSADMFPCQIRGDSEHQRLLFSSTASPAQLDMAAALGKNNKTEMSNTEITSDAESPLRHVQAQFS
jgi:hypothetical protein